VGDGSIEADVEMISMLVTALQKAGLEEFQISIGQVHYFNSLLAEANLTPEVENALRYQISNKNIFAVEEILEKNEMPAKLKNAFMALTSLSGSVEVLEKAKQLTENARALLAISFLENVYEGLKKCGCDKYVSFDLSMLSKYDYYTGIIFRAYTFGCGAAIAKGGRYDKLLSHFGRKLPAIGFVIVIDQLMTALENKEKENIKITPEGDRYLTFALCKGRLAKKTLELFEKIGIHMEEMKDPNTRKLIFVNEELKLRFFLAKGPDVPTYVEYGAADIGVVGSDTILEEGRKMYEVLDLGFGKCRMCVCGPASAKEKLDNLELIRVATKYPKIAKNYFYNQKQQTVEIIKLNGSIELAPIVGLADVIVDIVETGSTLRENGLDVLEEIKPLSARMVVNRVSMKMERERIVKLIQDIKSVL
jgi:ATP phosphoribosyltransferase